VRARPRERGQARTEGQAILTSHLDVFQVETASHVQKGARRGSWGSTPRVQNMRVAGGSTRRGSTRRGSTRWGSTPRVQNVRVAGGSTRRGSTCRGSTPGVRKLRVARGIIRRGSTRRGSTLHLQKLRKTCWEYSSREHSPEEYFLPPKVEGF